MKLEEHEMMSVKAFGQPYTKVHLWLDEFFSTLGARHRRKRHHLQGIEEVRRRWGDDAAFVARLHVVQDLEGEGFVEGKDAMPRDEADYVRKGFF